jgi:hypothetical protein
LPQHLTAETKQTFKNDLLSQHRNGKTTADFKNGLSSQHTIKEKEAMVNVKLIVAAYDGRK